MRYLVPKPMKPLFLMVSIAVLAIGATAWFVHHGHEGDAQDLEAIEPDAAPAGTEVGNSGVLADPELRASGT